MYFAGGNLKQLARGRGQEWNTVDFGGCTKRCALCERVADELVVTRSEALHLTVVTRKQSACLQWFDWTDYGIHYVRGSAYQ